MLHFLNKLAWGKIQAVQSFLIPSFLFSLSFHPFPSPPRTMSLENVLAVQVILCSLFSKVLHFLFKMGFHVAQDSLKFVMQLQLVLNSPVAPIWVLDIQKSIFTLSYLHSFNNFFYNVLSSIVCNVFHKIATFQEVLSPQLLFSVFFPRKSKMPCMKTLFFFQISKHVACQTSNHLL